MCIRDRAGTKKNNRAPFPSPGGLYDTNCYNTALTERHKTCLLYTSRFGVSTDTLRHYERIGLIPQIARTAGGIRDYKISKYENAIKTDVYKRQLTMVSFTDVFICGNRLFVT